MNISKVLSLPTHVINLFTLTEPSEIMAYCKRHNIKYYLYAFTCDDNTVMKYGMSMGDDKHLGERIYRQAAHIPGWGKIPTSSSGADMGKICSKFFPYVTRHDVSIKIWDATNYNFVSSNILNEVKHGEDALIQNHKFTVGIKPAGNIQETKTRLEPITETALFNRFF